MNIALRKAYLWAFIALIGMTGFYLAIMFLTMSPFEVWFNFKEFWYLIVGIIIGFSVQIGLFAYLKNIYKNHVHGSVTSASGAMSGTAMIACCAHHAADLLPILGISGAAIFLTQYQKAFLVLGLSINMLGIAYMLYKLMKIRENN